MSTRPARAAPFTRSVTPLLFATGLALLYALEVAVVRSGRFDARPGLLGLAVTLDLAIVVPAVYWAAFVRTGRAAPRTVLPAVVLSLLGVSLVLPDSSLGGARALRLLVAPAEVAVVWYAVSRTVRGVRALRASPDGRDVTDVLGESCRAALGDNLAARAVASELATLYYALGAWRATDAAPAGARAFTYRDVLNARLVVYGFGLAVAVETVPVHLLLARWHPAAAWTATLLGLYSLLWLAGDFRAMRLRPVLIDATHLWLRVGLRAQARVPLADLTAVERTSWRTLPTAAADYLSLARPSDPQLVVSVARPVVVERLFGLRRSVRRLGLAVDDPEEFVRALRERSAALAGPHARAE